MLGEEKDADAITGRSDKAAWDMFTSPSKLLNQIWEGRQGNSNQEEELDFGADDKCSSVGEDSFYYKGECDDILASKEKLRKV